MVQICSYKKFRIVWSAILAILLTSCSEIEEPTNLEPLIKNLKVSEITRTSAKLTAEIELRGSGSLETFYFIYSSEDGEELKTEDINDPSGIIETVISDLTPGTNYTVRGNGIRNTAVITSDTITFTTEANEKPSVSQLSEVSKGPNAILVKFEIIADGGENITESGCYVGKANEDALVKVRSAEEYSNDSTLFCLIGSLEKLTDYVLYPYAANSIGETVGEAYRFTTSDAVSLTRAGDLEDILAGSTDIGETLTISGFMNGDDFKYLRFLLSSSVKNLDISDVSILEGGSSYDGSRFTEEGIITTGLFADCSELESIVLPIKAKEIERNAFSRSNALRSIDISANVTSLLPSSSCESLEQLDVSEANSSFKSYDGVIYDYGLTNLIWYPEAKTGLLTLPPSMEEIAESAFAKAKIEYIALPENLQEIGRCAFEGSMLREVTIPGKIRNVREGLLQNCGQLKTVVFGESVEFIGNYVFDNSNVEELHILSSLPPYVSSAAFSNNADLYDNCVLYVAKGSRSLYKNHSIWGRFKNIYE